MSGSSVVMSNLVSVGLLVIWIVSVTAAEGNINIAFLRKVLSPDGPDAKEYDLVSYSLTNRNETTIAWSFKVDQNQPKQFLTSHGPSGIFCWLTKLQPLLHPEIHCFNATSKDRSFITIALPRTFPPPEVAKPKSECTSSKSKSSSKNFIPRIELDVSGKTVYWTDPAVNWIWATSMHTKQSRVIEQGTMMAKSELLQVDSVSGTFILKQKDKYFKLPINTLEASDEDFLDELEQICKLTATNISMSAPAIDPQKNVVYCASYNKVNLTCTISAFPLSRGSVYHVPERALPDLKPLKKVIDLEDCKQPLVLRYFENKLFWQGGNQTIFYVNLVDRPNNITAFEAPPDLDLRYVTMYNLEGTTRSTEVCSTSLCSDICIPAKDRFVMATCACSSTEVLIDSRTCVPMELAAAVVDTSNGSNYNIFRVFQPRRDLSPSSSEFRACKDLNQEGTDLLITNYEQGNPATNSSAVGIKENCSPNPALQHLESLIFKDLAVLGFIEKIQFDSQAVGIWILRARKNVQNCIEWYTIKTRNDISAHCARRSNTIHRFGIDSEKGLLFWVERESAQRQWKISVRGKSLADDRDIVHISVKEIPRGLAVDSGQNRLLWVIGDDLFVANYDGSGLKKLYRDAFDDKLELPNFSHFGNSLFWCNGNHLTIFNLDMVPEVNLTNVKSDNGKLSICTAVALPPPLLNLTKGMSWSGKDPCDGCSYACFPLGRNNYECRCPDLMYSETDGGASTTCLPMVAFLLYGKGTNTSKPEIRRVPKLSELQVSQSKETPPVIDGYGRYLETPPDIQATAEDQTISNDTVTTGYADQDVYYKCEMKRQYGTVTCYNSSGTQVFSVSGINPNTTLLKFGSHGDEVYFNDGNFGHIFLKSRKLDAILRFEPFYLKNPVEFWTLDVFAKIIFWKERQSGIKFRRLTDISEYEDRPCAQIEEQATQMAVDIELGMLFFTTSSELIRISYKDLFTKSPGYETLAILPWTLRNNLQTVFPTSSLTTYKGYVLWLSNSQFLLSYNTKNQQLTSLDLKHKPGGLVQNLVLPEVQVTTDPCRKSSCSHFCVPEISFRQSHGSSYKCLCPIGYMVTDGGRSCELPPDHTSITVYIAIASCIAALIIVALIISTIRNRRRNFELERVIYEIQYGNKRALKLAQNDLDKAIYMPLQDCIINPSDLAVNEKKVLGEGEFGLVLQGVYKTVIVAVKTVKATFTIEQLQDFAKEVKIMRYIGHHPGIVTFYGTEISGIKRGNFFAVLEYSHHGCLLNLLRKNDPSANSTSSGDNASPADQAFEMQEVTKPEAPPEYVNSPLQANVEAMVDWAAQIASAMAYLTTKNIVHGDLAARNILVFDNKVVKVTDFGLSKQLYSYANYTLKTRRPMPWRWLAPETMSRFEFSSSSDVWAYGVMLWEIFTYGKIPYPEYMWDASFQQKIQEGSLRLSKPPIAPEGFYEQVMMPCWGIHKDQRPSFGDLVGLCQNFKGGSTYINLFHST